MSILCVEWLCTQERWNPKVAIIVGVAARYRRATVGSSHDDTHSDNSTLHAEAVRPTPALWRVSLLHIAPYLGYGSSQMFEVLPAFS
jgi:hypothetical protein